MALLVPVILSGGAGTRLWPLSREMYPKQLLALTGKHTMLQDTVLRLAGIAGAAPPIELSDNGPDRIPRKPFGKTVHATRECELQVSAEQILLGEADH